jgi:RNA polymerase sigma factor (sigma-70 family)
MLSKELNEVYLSARSRITRLVSRIVPPKEVEDILQDTYVRLCQVQHPDQIRHPRSFILRTARNLAFDHVKRSEYRLRDTWDEESFTGVGNRDAQRDETFASVVSNEEFALFCDSVRHLPIQCRRVFVLKKVYGYSQAEIAQELDLSQSTVEKHIALGIKRCSHFMTRRQSGGSSSALARAANGADYE